MFTWHRPSPTPSCTVWTPGAPTAATEAKTRAVVEWGDAGGELPMTILRDPVTGQVRPILHRPMAAAMGAVGEPELQALFSCGIPDVADQGAVKCHQAYLPVSPSTFFRLKD